MNRRNLLKTFLIGMLIPWNFQNDEIVTNPPTGGTYTITFKGKTTSSIPYNATAEDVQKALRCLGYTVPIHIIN